MPTDTSRMRLIATKTSKHSKIAKHWLVYDDAGRAFIQRFVGGKLDLEWHNDLSPERWVGNNHGFVLTNGDAASVKGKRPGRPPNRPIASGTSIDMPYVMKNPFDDRRG